MIQAKETKQKECRREKEEKKNDVNKLYGEGKKERRGEGREKGREGRKIERSSVPSAHTFLYIPF